MIYTIQNEFFSADVNSLGAELCRLTSRGGIEFLCPAERRNWEGSAPLLFPNAGAVKDGYALIDGERYPYRQHGFARAMEFTLHNQRENVLELLLCWNEESLLHCPYHFVLSVRYALVGRRLEISTGTENQGMRTMYYSLGFHPGFSCPLLPEETAEDYQLTFLKPMSAARVLLKDALVCGRIEHFWNGALSLPIRDGMFDNGSYTMTDLSCRSVRLESKRSGCFLQVELGDFPNLVLWAPKQKCITNICIEPWYGLPDAETSDLQVSSKPFSISLDPGMEKTLSYSIMLGTEE